MLVAGTWIYGRQAKQIEHIEIGDEVYTAEGDLVKVASVGKSQAARQIKVIPRGSSPVICTPDHQFLVYRDGQTWVPAVDLSIRDHLTTPAFSMYSQLKSTDDNAFYHAIKAIEVIDQDADVYSIGLDHPQQSFLANSIAVC